MTHTKLIAATFIAASLAACSDPQIDMDAYPAIGTEKDTRQRHRPLPSVVQAQIEATEAYKAGIEARRADRQRILEAE